MKFSVLSSGSKQNCFYLENGGSAILIDAGLNYATVDRYLAEIGGDISKVKAIFITHEHWDHTQGLLSFMKNCELPVFIDEKSRKESRIKIRNACPLRGGISMTMEGFELTPFPVSHDAANTFGYMVRAEGKTLFLASDIGSFDDRVLEYAQSADAIAIESNYDLEMLKKSAYPSFLKKRIHSGSGHLSNEDALEFLRRAIRRDTKNVFLLHLSENSNSMDLVRKMIDDHLSGRFPGVHFHISRRESPLSLIPL